MSEKLYQAIGDIKEKHILEAEQFSAAAQNDSITSGGVTRKSVGKAWKIWGALAACLVLVVALGALGQTPLGQGNLIQAENPTIIGGIERNYKKNSAMSQEVSIIWPAEYLLEHEKYNSLTFDGWNYRTRANAVGEHLLGEVLGSGTGQGYDIYTEQTLTEEFEVRQILQVSPELLIAVAMDDGWYVYIQDEYAPPQTLGQMLEEGSLSDTLTLQRFSNYEGFTAKGHYTIEDDSDIWQVLSQCGEAAIIEGKNAEDWNWSRGERNYISFTATSESLGIYKKVFSITEDGYVDTNIFEYGYLFYIGEEAAGQIISYVRNNAVPAAPEVYEYRLAGTLMAIEDGYVLIDDTILCRDPEEGMVFKVPTEDIRVRRCIEFGGLKEGDIVVVSFRGNVDVENENTIRGARGIERGFLEDGSVYTLE